MKFLSFLSLLLISLSQAVTDLQIHIFDVGQGNSQLIVFPSGYSIFIDAPEYSWNSASESAVIANKLSAILGGKKTIDVGIVTHLHLDHVGYATKGGMWALIEKYGYTFGTLLDRDHGVWKDSNQDSVCSENEIEWHNIGELSTITTRWICYVTDPASSVYKHRIIPQIGSTTQISPPDKLAKVTIVAGDAIGAVMNDGKTLVGGDHRNSSCPPNENDYSIGFVLQYGKFRYGTFGDLDGMYIEGFGMCYNNIESSVMPRIGAELDVSTVNHHGSFRSSNAAFLSVTKPSVNIISCGFNNSYGLPHQVTVDRLLPLGDLYITELGNPQVKYGNAVITNSDIVITISSTGDTYTVTANGNSKKHKSKGTSQN